MRRHLKMLDSQPLLSFSIDSKRTCDVVKEIHVCRSHWKRPFPDRQVRRVFHPVPSRPEFQARLPSPASRLASSSTLPFEQPRSIAHRPSHPNFSTASRCKWHLATGRNTAAKRRFRLTLFNAISLKSPVISHIVLVMMLTGSSLYPSRREVAIWIPD
jgi:hypothetical protein